MSKLKAVDPKTAEPRKPKILLFGKPGVGKTWGSLDFPSVYYIDSEGGATRAQYTEKLQKSGGVYFGPDQGAADFNEVINEIKALATEKHNYRTVVIDSISKIYNSEITKEQERLGDKDAFGASKKPATSLTRRLTSWIDRIDMNVILIAHEKAEWANGQQIGDTFDAYEKLAYELDLTLQIVKQGDSRKARIRKSRLLGFPDASLFDWSYEEFAKRYGKEVIEKKSEAIVLATPEQLQKLHDLLEITKLPDGTTDKWLTAAGVNSFDEMDADKISKCIISLEDRHNKAQTVKGK